MQVTIKNMEDLDISKFCSVMDEVQGELEEAISQFSSFASQHEGYAVIKEELDELWDAIKSKEASTQDTMNEAIQVAAMAIRFLMDLDPERLA